MIKQFLTGLCGVGLILCAGEGQAVAASIAACGDVNVEATARCEVKTGIDCEAQCTPLSCNASLYAQCNGQCNITPPSCDVSCSGSCEAKCSANANFDCSADCRATCEGNCSGDCQAHCASKSGDTDCVANCQGSCKATCDGECNVSCEGKAQVDCKGKCSASCQGSCNASASVDCQADCQAKAYATCTGGCKAECRNTGEGALFCNGEWVDHGGNLDECIQALREQLNIQVSGSASCSGNSCQAEGKASASCAVSQPGKDAGSWIGLGLFGAVATGLVLRRRQRRGL
ncbi:MAG TPA: hypothetical protein VKP30_11545 [Polyangiaceae bacterium]|nr:hypothetical protein [Polyangiaceae bacterium]